MEPSSEVGSYINTKKKRSDEEIKYIVFWEYDKKDEEALFKKLPFTGDLNRLSSSYYLGGQTKGFTLVEEEDFEKIEKHYQHFAPMARTKVLPIIELTKVLEVRKY
jgi:hypothetical protein